MKGETNKEKINGAEAVGRMAVEHAEALGYRPLVEMHCAFDSVCSRRVLAAKTAYIQQFGDADRVYKRAIKRTMPAMCDALKLCNDLPATLDPDNVFVGLRESITLRCQEVLGFCTDIVHGNDRSKRLDLTETLDLFDYTAHYFSMHIGHLMLQLGSKSKRWMEVDE